MRRVIPVSIISVPTKRRLYSGYMHILPYLPLDLDLGLSTLYALGGEEGSLPLSAFLESSLRMAASKAASGSSAGLITGWW